MIAYSYKDSCCSNIQSIFVEIYLPKPKAILLGILYRPPDFVKSDFVKHINNIFIETKILHKQESYLLGDLNINLLLDKKEIFSNKSHKTNGQLLPPLLKGHIDCCFFFSLEQVILVPTRVPSKTATVTDHVLTNSSQKVNVVWLNYIYLITILYIVQEKHLHLSSINTMKYLLGQWKSTNKKDF